MAPVRKVIRCQRKSLYKQDKITKTGILDIF